MRTKKSLLIAGVLVAVAGCHSNHARARQAQGAVSAAATQVSRMINGAMENHPVEVTPPLEATLRLPALALLGNGDSARLQANSDAAHTGVNSVRTPQGWALAWGDPARSCAVVARTDANGQPSAVGPVMVHETQTDEEDVVAPALAQSDDETAMVWLDPANGRVRFVRLGDDGHPTGRTTTVADGLEMPTSARMVWDGSAFAVAVGLEHGVYFERVDPASGHRIGTGAILAEESVESPDLDVLTATRAGFTLAWHRGTGERQEIHLDHDGHVVDPNGSAGRGHGIRLAAR